MIHWDGFDGFCCSTSFVVFVSWCRQGPISGGWRFRNPTDHLLYMNPYEPWKICYISTSFSRKIVFFHSARFFKTIFQRFFFLVPILFSSFPHFRPGLAPRCFAWQFQVTQWKSSWQSFIKHRFMKAMVADDHSHISDKWWVTTISLAFPRLGF